MLPEELANTTKPDETPDSDGGGNALDGAGKESDRAAPSGAGSTDGRASDVAAPEPSVDDKNSAPFGVGLTVPAPSVPAHQPDPPPSDVDTTQADADTNEAVSSTPESAAPPGAASIGDDAAKASGESGEPVAAQIPPGKVIDAAERDGIRDAASASMDAASTESKDDESRSESTEGDSSHRRVEDVRRHRILREHDPATDADISPDDKELAARQPRESTDWDNEVSAHALVVELKRVETEVRELLSDRDPRRKRKLAGTRRWYELEEDLTAAMYARRFDDEVMARLRMLVALRHRLFKRLRFVSGTRPTWNT